MIGKVEDEVAEVGKEVQQVGGEEGGGEFRRRVERWRRGRGSRGEDDDWGRWRMRWRGQERWSRWEEVNIIGFEIR